MKFFSKTFVRYVVLLSLVPNAIAQEVSRPPNASIDPCPGGVSYAEVDSAVVPKTLDQLISMSNLIIVGTVANVQAATLMSANRPSLTETDSQVAIRQLLLGMLPPGINSVLVSQAGGKVGTCTLVVPSDPLVKLSEDYVLFLIDDNRTFPPKAVSVPRYAVAGIWSGKVKIVNGQIEFAPAANPNLHQYDKTDANGFVALLQKRLSEIRPQKDPGRK